jgi:hypothetical protein
MQTQSQLTKDNVEDHKCEERKRLSVSDYFTDEDEDESKVGEVLFKPDNNKTHPYTPINNQKQDLKGGPRTEEFDRQGLKASGEQFEGKQRLFSNERYHDGSFKSEERTNHGSTPDRVSSNLEKVS